MTESVLTNVNDDDICDEDFGNDAGTLHTANLLIKLYHNIIYEYTMKKSKNILKQWKNIV